MPKIEPSPEMKQALEDAAAAMEAECADCGQKGLHFCPARSPGQRKPAAVTGWQCPVCGAGVAPGVAVCPNPHQPQRGTHGGATIIQR